jgi:lycopene beta-cyclase
LCRVESCCAHDTILIIDKDEKNRNDRTWCFWEKEVGLFQSVVSKEWEQLHFYSDTVAKQLEIAPYKYKLIRGIEFYNYCKNLLSQYSNVHWLHAAVDDIKNESGGVIVKAGGEEYNAHYCFNSIIFQKPQLKQNEYWLLQHFKGLYIRAAAGTFNPQSATLMDFRFSQKNGTTFFYVLPLSDSGALVEYTLFSKNLLQQEQYDVALKEYINNRLSISNYDVIEEEFGVIPMTNYNFNSIDGNIINIGTAGGQTKGSSGYTFRFIQKHAAAIVRCLIEIGKPYNLETASKRFQFYDSVLLNILHRNTLPGDKIFSELFKRNKASDVFKFLDNETSLAEELRIISSLPTLPFAKAALHHLF